MYRAIPSRYPYEGSSLNSRNLVLRNEESVHSINLSDTCNVSYVFTIIDWLSIVYGRLELAICKEYGPY